MELVCTMALGGDIHSAWYDISIALHLGWDWAFGSSFSCDGMEAALRASWAGSRAFVIQLWL